MSLQGTLAPLIIGAGLLAQQPCVAPAPAPALDHVILAVHDLDRAGAEFERSGFRLKPGRLHANNLLNRHIKFPDGTSIELMTVRGEPGDAMARDYSSLIAAGEGGVYVALTVSSVDTPRRVARALELSTIQSTSGPWRFVSFPPSSPAAAVFFGTSGPPASDPDSLLSHEPPILGLAEAWVEGGRDLTALLERLGARRCGTERAPDGRMGERWALARGAIVVVPQRPPARPRVIGVVLRRAEPGDATVHPHRELWVRIRHGDD